MSDSRYLRWILSLTLIGTAVCASAQEQLEERIPSPKSFEDLISVEISEIDSFDDAVPIDATAAPGETLQDAFSIALSLDPEIRSARWSTSSAQKGLRAAQAEKYPSIAARSSYSVFDNPLQINAPVAALPPVLPEPITASVTVNQREFYLGGVHVTQPLYTFGKITNAIDSAQADVCAAVADSQRTELDVKIQVATAYIGVLQARQLLEVAKSGVATLTDHERTVKNLVAEGVGIRANLLAVQVALANAKQLELQTDNLETVAKAAYNRALQRPLDQAVFIEDLQPTHAQYDLDAMIAQGLGTRPEIQFLSAKAVALRKLGDSIKAGNLPQVVLDGGFDYIENRFLDNNSYNSVAVLAEWNFFDSGRKRHRTDQLKHSAEALIRKRMNVESLIALEVKKAWHNLNSAQQQVLVNEETLKASDENLRVSQNRYKEGEGTNTEVLDAQTLRTQAYSNYYHSVYSAVLAETQLLRAVGTL